MGFPSETSVHLNTTACTLRSKFLPRGYSLVRGTLVKVWENSKKLWKHSPAALVPTAFLVLPNCYSCFYNSILLTTCIYISHDPVHVFYFLNMIVSIHQKIFCK